MIYLDNAATSCQKPEEVIKAVTEAMLSLGSSGRGAHEASLDASRLIFDTRRLIAELFHAGDPSCVAFTANSTVSLNIAIQGLFQPGDHVITTMMEHNSVLRPLYLMEEQGVKLTILPADQKGRIRYEDIEDEVGQNTKAVVCTHASNLTGNINDLEAIGRICKKNGLLLVADVSQTAGVFDIDMERMGIHVLCFTGHKGLLGPQGTGGICVRQGVSIRPLMVGGSGVKSYLKTQPEEMPEVLEAGTLNGHGIAGLHAALLYLEKTGIETIRKKELFLMRRFYEGVKDIPGVQVYGDFSENALLYRAPVVALNIGNYDSGEVADELASVYGIYTRAGAHCAPLMHRALGTVEQGAVRFSMSHYNKKEEIDEAIGAVRELSL
ncbi:MAG TPA: cysteine desulfurase [Lachnoclostridium sp.]|uniref:aminotransferase class V-fold PLP-dependent enzyme n=1 Tax=Lacrimispora sp. TaxID=2719234 RepID=UPI000EF07458|nr:aminotransferase class V-fold PLP-dependent enzyme [Lacrimispora sp.]HCD46355.1 cysteine desulfurase [Lachnoclostridium sp.]